MFRRPDGHIIHPSAKADIQAKAGGLIPDGYLAPGQQAAFIAQLIGGAGAGRGALFKAQAHIRAAAVDIRGHVDGGEAVIARRLQPYGLPDAADRGVPAAHQAFFPVLLAAGLAAIGLVLHPQAQVVLALLQQGGDIKAKGGIAAAVGARHQAVYVHLGFKIHRAKAQEDAPAPHIRGHGETAAIPQIGVDGFIPDAAFLALIAERHQDAAAQIISRLIPGLRFTPVCIVKRESPGAVEVMKRIAYKIRSWMFRPWDDAHC